MSWKVCKIFSLFWWYLLSTGQPLGGNASSMSCIILPSPAPTCKGKDNWLQHKVITENQFLSSVHSYMNFQCLSCPCCWNVHVFHSHFHSELVHCTSVFSWVEKAAQAGFLKLFPMTTLLVNTFAANQTEYPATFYWRIGSSAIPVINLDSEAKEANLLNAIWHGWLKSCYLHTVYWSIHLLLLCIIKTPAGFCLLFPMHCF